jgi:hypothetical protein
MAHLPDIVQFTEWDPAMTPGLKKSTRILALHKDGTLSLVYLDVVRMSGLIVPFDIST